MSINENSVRHSRSSQLPDAVIQHRLVSGARADRLPPDPTTNPVRTASAPDCVSLRSPQEAGPYLELLRSLEVTRARNRVHLDVAPEPDEDHAGAVRALVQAGAVRVDAGRGEIGWAVLADPEGSEFCVLSPR